MANKHREKRQAKNKLVILITGASSGFGKACAEHLSREGNTVYGTSRRVQTSYSKDSQNFKNDFPRMIHMDVCDGSSVEKGIDYIIQQEDRLDVVVNNAGMGIAGSVEDSSIEEVRHQFETNFFGVLRICRAALPHMRKQGTGYIVNISSLAGLLGIPFQGAYSASKFALEGLTEALRMEAKPFGIKVSIIEPGDFKTGFTSNRKKTLQSQQNLIYKDKFNTALGVMEKEEMSGPNPERLAFLLERIINHPSPRLRYTVGFIPQRVAAFLKRIVPASFFEWAVMKTYKLI